MHEEAYCSRPHHCDDGVLVAPADVLHAAVAAVPTFDGITALMLWFAENFGMIVAVSRQYILYFHQQSLRKYTPWRHTPAQRLYVTSCQVASSMLVTLVKQLHNTAVISHVCNRVFPIVCRSQGTLCCIW
jgi:hypothetical protein